MMNLNQRPRRLRQNRVLRQLAQETDLLRHDLIYPVFIVEGEKQMQSIPSMPGQYRMSLDSLVPVCEKALRMGIGAIALFPSIEASKKDSQATEALNPDNLVVRALLFLKKRFPELVVITDIALDPFSSDGHDGLVKNGIILNDETVEILGSMALLHAEAGADIVAPSDMMDGRVGAIREQLDIKGFTDRGIIAYSAKYASAFYGPFRDALESSPKFGDKMTYQLNPRNVREALLEAELDTIEGADMLMVKPALPYHDV